MRILIADDHFAVREGLKTILKPHPAFEVVAESVSLDTTRKCLAPNEIDLVLLDINFPDGNGLDLVSEFPTCRFLILSMYQEGAFVLKALQAGAQGFIGKDSAGPVLVQALGAIVGGHIFLDQVSLDSLSAHLRTLPVELTRTDHCLAMLSTREKDVFYGILRGENTKTIALKLDLSPKTVDNYRSGLFAKLNLKSAVELVRFAQEHKVF